MLLIPSLKEGEGKGGEEGGGGERIPVRVCSPVGVSSCKNVGNMLSSINAMSKKTPHDRVLMTKWKGTDSCKKYI